MFLFSSDEKVYLTLNQGAKYFKDKKLKDHDIVKISKSLYEILDSPESEPIDINLKSETKLGRDYEKTTISGFKYYSDDMPDSSIIIGDIIKLLNDYKQLVKTFKERDKILTNFINIY